MQPLTPFFSKDAQKHLGHLEDHQKIAHSTQELTVKQLKETDVVAVLPTSCGMQPIYSCRILLPEASSNTF
jgi:hypothetical protein